MAKKFLTSIDLTKQELLNARIQNLGSAPSSPVSGQVYYDTGLNKFGFYNGSTWIYSATAKADVGLGNVDNTSDANKPVSTAQQTALNLKANTADLSDVAFSGDYNDLLNQPAITAGQPSKVIVDGETPYTVLAGDRGKILYFITSSPNTLTIPDDFDEGFSFWVWNGGSGDITVTQATNGTIGPVTPGRAALFTLIEAGEGYPADTYASYQWRGLSEAFTAAETSYDNTASGLGATTVQEAIDDLHGADVSLDADIALKAPLASPTFTGTVTVPTPTNDTDATTKLYVDNAVFGLSWKDAVRVASTANVTIASALENGDTLDGITLATGDRVLLRAQTDAKENGIYTVVASGAASRAVDANSTDEIRALTVFVDRGTYADTVWTLTTNDPVLGTDNLVFAQINGGAVPTASTSTAGKVQLATQAEAQAKSDSAKALTAASVADFARKYTGTIGDGSSTSIGVTHGLGTQYVTAQVFDATSNVHVECDVTLTNSTTTTFAFAVAPSTNQYRVVITG